MLQTGSTGHHGPDADPCCSQVCGPTSAACVTRPSPNAALWSPTSKRSMACSRSMHTRSAGPSCMCVKNVAAHLRVRRVMSCTSRKTTPTAHCYERPPRKWLWPCRILSLPYCRAAPTSEQPRPQEGPGSLPCCPAGSPSCSLLPEHQYQDQSPKASRQAHRTLRH